MREVEINFCKAMTEKVAGKQGVDNKLRYLLEDFFMKKVGHLRLMLKL